MTDRPVLIVTGDSRGIGKYLCEYYAQREFQVVGCSRSTPTFDVSANHAHYQLDVSSEDDVAKFFIELRKRYGRADILINAAAVNEALALALMVSHKRAQQTMNTTFFGTFLMSKEATKLMMRRKFGRIINFGSMAVRHEVRGEAMYTAAKAAVHSFSRVFAKEIFAHGITCNVLSPAALETDMTAAIDAKALKEVLSRNAVPNMGQMAEISNLIDFLIRPESHTITGQNIYLGGV